MIKCTILLSIIANSIAHMGSPNSPHSPLKSPNSPKTDCSQFTCAKDCNDSCGWSSLFNRCLSGSTTTINEINKGPGCLINPTTASTTASTTTTTSTATTSTATAKTYTTTAKTSTSTIATTIATTASTTTSTTDTTIATISSTASTNASTTATTSTIWFLNNSVLNNTLKLASGNYYDTNSLSSISKNNKSLESTLAISITTALVCFIGMVIYRRRNKVDEKDKINIVSNNVINPIYKYNKDDNIDENLYMEPVPLNERKNNSEIYNTIPEHIYNIGNNEENDDYLDITYELATTEDNIDNNSSLYEFATNEDSNYSNYNNNSSLYEFATNEDSKNSNYNNNNSLYEFAT